MYTLGITQGSHANRGPDEYFNKLQAWANDPAFAAVTGKNSAPMRSIHGFFQEAFARPVEPAKQGGRELGQGVIRAIDYVGPHVDDVSLHSNWDVNRLRHQFAWNLYLSVGEHGGQTVVYGRTLDSKVDLRTAPQLRMMPSVGELIVFNSRLVHEVLVSSPAKRRISINGMFSPKPRGQQDIVTWS
ncbi:MAG TPA: 2OG-Fe(II) oxygenase [Candidatus Peribacteria bacterium]|nr:2OG-Fe(II) oxygenase [Candidatus Peribacteria bacterium]